MLLKEGETMNKEQQGNSKSENPFNQGASKLKQMPLLFSSLEHCNLLSKQPNYTCGLFFFDLMFMVMSWARAILSISKKAWTFPARPYYYTLYFQKLIESPTTVRQKEKGTYGPRDSLEGKGCLQVPFSARRLRRGHIGPPGQPRVRKSCLAGFSLVPWPCHELGAPRRLPIHGDPPGKITGMAMLSSRASSQPRNLTKVSRLTGGFFLKPVLLWQPDWVSWRGVTGAPFGRLAV